MFLFHLTTALFLPVSPELHVGSLRSFVFEVTDHSCMYLHENRLPISEYYPLGISRNRSSGKLLLVWLNGWKTHTVERKKKEGRKGGRREEEKGREQKIKEAVP